MNVYYDNRVYSIVTEFDSAAGDQQCIPPYALRMICEAQLNIKWLVPRIIAREMFLAWRNGGNVRDAYVAGITRYLIMQQIARLAIDLQTKPILRLKTKADVLIGRMRKAVTKLWREDHE